MREHEQGHYRHLIAGRLTMAPSVRKFALNVHVISSVGWLGALAVFLAHAIAGLISNDEQMVRATSLAMRLTAWFVILPLSLASLISGLVQGLGTAWGLIRHYWVLFKLLLTAIATIVLLLKLGPISHLANAAAGTAFSSHDLVTLRTSVMVHAAGGLLVLLAAVTLAIYKPQGLTQYGLRKQLGQGSAAPGIASARGVPPWVKVFGFIVAILFIMVGVMLLGGEHGPSAHMPQ